MSCKICSSKKVKKVNEAKYTFILCSACGVKYHIPIPKKDYLKGWYSKKLFSKRWRGKINKALSVHYAQNKDNFEYYYGLLGAQINDFSNKKILDVGCYAGHMLTHFPHTATRIGVDYNEATLAYGVRTFDLDLRVGDIDTVQGLTFDIILFNQVLEHLPDPLRFLHKVHGMLSPNGVIQFSVPDYAINKKIDYPAHIFHFTKKSLNTALRRCGFLGKLIRRKNQLALVGTAIKNKEGT